jgi:hypothetical protein
LCAGGLVHNLDSSLAYHAPIPGGGGYDVALRAHQRTRGLDLPDLRSPRLVALQARRLTPGSGCALGLLIRLRAWGKLMQLPIDSFFHEGHVVERKHWVDVRLALKLTTRKMTIAGRAVSGCNVPVTTASDAVGELAKGQPFAAGYYGGEAGRRFSLRSDPNGLDVSDIAASYGGGGHRSASGFFAPRGWEGDRRPFVEWERPRNRAGADLIRAEITDYRLRSSPICHR